MSIEATGRLGSDDGFDTGAWESTSVSEETEDEENGEVEVPAKGEDRIWLVQCKREKSIPPAKMSSHLEKILIDGKQKPYGIILAAACDFSKR